MPKKDANTVSNKLTAVSVGADAIGAACRPYIILNI